MYTGPDHLGFYYLFNFPYCPEHQGFFYFLFYYLCSEFSSFRCLLLDNFRRLIKRLLYFANRLIFDFHSSFYTFLMITCFIFLIIAVVNSLNTIRGAVIAVRSIVDTFYIWDIKFVRLILVAVYSVKKVIHSYFVTENIYFVWVTYVHIFPKPSYLSNLCGFFLYYSTNAEQCVYCCQKICTFILN